MKHCCWLSWIFIVIIYNSIETTRLLISWPVVMRVSPLSTHLLGLSAKRHSYHLHAHCIWESLLYALAQGHAQPHDCHVIEQQDRRHKRYQWAHVAPQLPCYYVRQPYEAQTTPPWPPGPTDAISDNQQMAMIWCWQLAGKHPPLQYCMTPLTTHHTSTISPKTNGSTIASSKHAQPHDHQMTMTPYKASITPPQPPHLPCHDARQPVDSHNMMLQPAGKHPPLQYCTIPLTPHHTPTMSPETNGSPIASSKHCWNTLQHDEQIHSKVIMGLQMNKEGG